MNYSNKGYAPLNESKKANDIQVVFLSSRAEKTTKSSNSMFFFEDAAKKAGLKMVTIDPSSSAITKGVGDNYNVVENGDTKKVFTLNPNNTIIVPRRTVLKNIESRDFLTELQNDGFFVLNTLDAIDNCEDKFITYKKLKAAGVPTPKTAVVTSSSMNKLEDKVNAVGGGFPLIIKITRGTQGIGVAQVDSMISLKSVLQAIFALVPKADILLQEKINSDYDLRIHVLYKGFERMTPGIDNFEIIGCMQRNQLAGDFRSNYSLGSTAEKGHLTKEQEDIAKKAAKATGCRWAGVDLIMDSRTKQSYVIEVNSSPGTKGITTAAGDDVVGTLMDMFKDFKYTKYDSDQIGKYETVTFKDLGEGIDVTMKFDDNKSFTELECSSVNANDDNVTFVFNGITYTVELSGLRKGEPMIETNIRFNGTVYKNELVVLKTVNDNINSNIAIGGTKLLHRISDKAVVVEGSFILTDNTTGFAIPAEKMNEGLQYENGASVINESNVRLGGLRNLITRFVQGNNVRYSQANWSIESLDESESRDSWTLSYDGVTVLECRENYSSFKTNTVPYTLACKIAGVVESFYGHTVDMNVYESEEVSESLNEGLISDYKKRIEDENKEITGSDKRFIVKLLKEFNDIKLPFVFTCKNCEVISDSINEKKVDKTRAVTLHVDDEFEKDSERLHISQQSTLHILEEGNEWIYKDAEYKNIWKSIFKWFNEQFEKGGGKFDGVVKAKYLLSQQKEIKKNLL